MLSPAPPPPGGGPGSGGHSPTRLSGSIADSALRSQAAGGVGVCASVAPPAFGCRLGWVCDISRSRVSVLFAWYPYYSEELRVRSAPALAWD